MFDPARGGSAGLTLKNNFEGGSALATLTTPGDLGANYGAFNPSVSGGEESDNGKRKGKNSASSGGGSLRESMELNLPPERFLERRNLLTQLDALRRRSEQNGSIASAAEYEGKPLTCSLAE